MLHRLVILVLFMGTACSAVGQQPEALPESVPPAIRAQVETAKEGFRIDPTIQEQAQKVYQSTQTEAYRKRMNAAIEAVFPQSSQATDEEVKTGIRSDDRLYLFVSKSVPLPTLRRYAEALEETPGAVMLVRGFVEGGTRIRPTLEFIASILRKDANCRGAECEMRRVAVQVDPVLFRRYGIQAVPAVAVVEGLVTDGSCSEGNQDVVSVGAHQVVYGDAPVSTLLEQLSKESVGAVARYRVFFEKRGFYGGSG